MQFLSQKLRYLSSQLIKPRRYNYSQQSLYIYMQKNKQIKYQNLMIKNKRNQNLDTVIFKNVSNCYGSDTCILYAHGLGSNKIEVLPLVEFCKMYGYHVCAWDFSGSGRSDGQYTTYGLREQDDINAILGYLDSTRQYNRYILWGRSMGGTSIILSQSRNINRKVQCIILDSPFSSFQKAAIQIASRATNIPQIMLNLMIQPLKQQMRKQYSSINLNPFQINLCQAIKQIDIRVMLIYCKNDTVVNFLHSKEISKYCPKNTVELEIGEDHNKPRKKETYFQAFKFIEQSIELHQSRARRRSVSKGRGISVSSKQNVCSNSKPRASISINSSITSNKNNVIGNSFIGKRQNRSFNNTQKFVSIGSFMSSSSRDLCSQEGNVKKQMCIKSVLLDGVNRRDNIRNSVKFANVNKYKNYVKLL